MDAKRILKYLRQLSANNNREWFHAHKAEYDAIRADFEQGIQQAILRIAQFDNSIAHLSVKDCTYRFYRDTRFSNDKSPYKNHLGAYIAAHGKKALHGGYYLHLEPGHCMVACGNYWLPTNSPPSCRNEIMANVDEWLRCVQSPEFLRRPAPQVSHATGSISTTSARRITVAGTKCPTTSTRATAGSTISSPCSALPNP